MNKNKFLLLTLKLSMIILALFSSAIGMAQSDVEMADLMRSNGKIYAVVAVCLTILTGLFLYVMSIDSKLKKLEKENK